MNVVLWALAFALAAVFAASGIMKLTVPREKLIERTPYAADLPHSVVLTIGVVEVLGAAGLLLPGLLGIAPVLVPLGAAGLAITMALAFLTHIRRGDQLAQTLPAIVLLVLSTLLAWGRFGPYPL